MALRLDGGRATAPYPRLPGLADRPVQRQREEGKRRKDRIARFLRRNGLLP